MTSAKSGWRRIETEMAFRQAIVDRMVTSEGMRFTIHSDGRISGRIDHKCLTGTWYWIDRYFCRTARLDGEDLGLDCEVIEIRGGRMRYTRDKGRGGATIVMIE